MSFSSLANRLSHVISIPVTPFNTEHDIEWTQYEHLLHRLVDGGITVLTPNGNTGEFYSLTLAETEKIVQLTGKFADDKTLVLAGIGHDTATAIEMGKQAQSAGAQAVMVHQPPHPFRSAEGWLNYNQTIANALPEMGIVPYLRVASITADHL